MSTPREKLRKEYVETFSNRYLTPLRMSGALRFEIKDGAIVEKSLSVLWKAVVTFCLHNLSCFWVYYDLSYVNPCSLVTEQMILMILVTMQNLYSINISGPNRNSGVKLLDNCIDLDVLLGTKETKFLRVISQRVFIFYAGLIIVFKILSALGVLLTFPLFLGIVLFSTTFAPMMFVFYDYCFFFGICIFLTLRVRFLNVALIKMAKLNPGIFPKGFVLGEILWHDKFDDLVFFHKRSNRKQFVKAFKILHRQVEQIQKSYRFIMLLGLVGIIMSTFVMVQGIIIYLKSPDMNPLRLLSVTGWVLLGWTVIFGIVLSADIFHGQIEKTMLICIYIKLTPEMSKATLQLVDSVLNAIKNFNSQISIYGIGSLSTGQIVSIILSLLVYIIIELQLAFPDTHHVVTYNNTVSNG